MITRLVFVLLLIHSTIAQKAEKHPRKPSNSKWMTLDGESPLVIARGGFSGVFPEGSVYAYKIALATSSPNVTLFCDLQLTKDGKGLCLSSVKLENSTTIAQVFPDGKKSYNVSGHELRGWFALDYTAEQLFSNVTLVQNVNGRPIQFDYLPLLPVEEVARITKEPPIMWVNVEHNKLYTENKLEPALYVQKAMNSTGIQYISSPDIGFLKEMKGKLGKKPGRTKLVFRLVEGENAIEPTTQKPYRSILKDLSSIKSFASGILVPKEYIWPVNKQLYLEAQPTSLVGDAHKEGLQVFASGFANDNIGIFNYSYDPTAEYLQFIDNSQFSVDGFLTDFPSTATQTIACLANNKNASKPAGKTLIITHNGASGVYSACTDLAYQQAVDDGADIIDCSVQMSKDGVPFCMDSADLSGDTTAMTNFMSKSTMVPEIQNQNGIFSFDLTWPEIQTLKPQLKPAFPRENIIRNPANKNKGKFMTLPEFLNFSKNKKVAGILINIKNARYLASKKGLSITDVVVSALRNATFDKESTKKVLIQSDDSSVLSKFSNVPTYKRVMCIEKHVGDAPEKTVEEIKKFADAVNLRRISIINTNSNFFTVSNTSIVQEMHKANVSVYVSVFRNEFVSMAYDYFSDPMLEQASFIRDTGVDGIITEFPATATAYMKSPCAKPDAKAPHTMLAVKPGELLSLVHHGAMPPAEAPAPSLDVKEVVRPPLPPISNVSAASSSNAPAPAPAPSPQQSGDTKNVANVGIGLVALVLLALISTGY